MVLNIYDKTGNDTNNELTLHDLFINGIKENNIKLSNPDVTLFMIIELVGSTCFNSILYKDISVEEKNQIYSKILENEGMKNLIQEFSKLGSRVNRVLS